MRKATPETHGIGVLFRGGVNFLHGLAGERTIGGFRKGQHAAAFDVLLQRCQHIRRHILQIRGLKNDAVEGGIGQPVFAPLLWR